MKQNQPRRRSHTRVLPAAVGALLFAAACGATDPTPTPATSTSPTAGSQGATSNSTQQSTPAQSSASSAVTESDSAVSGQITVFAAASLKTSFTEIGKQFEAEHPGTTVTFSFAGSSDLVTQITNGAPADVFASADLRNMEKLTTAAQIQGDPINFATNTLTIVTPPDNPANINELADLGKGGLNLVICAPEVPCGAATKTVAEAAGMTLQPVSEESSVTDVLNKVISGEADAGLVYRTDASTAGDKVHTVPFPESAEAVNTYPIAALKESQNPSLAAKFVDFTVGPAGLSVLAAAGFQPAA